MNPTILQLAADLTTGRTTSRQLTEEALARIDDPNGEGARAFIKVYRQQASIMTALVRRFFPAGTRISTPQGGYVLWVELPERVDSMRLYQAALARSISGTRRSGHPSCAAVAARCRVAERLSTRRALGVSAGARSAAR